MNTKGSFLYYTIEDLSIILPNGNILSDYFPALKPVYDPENGDIVGSEPSTDLSIENRLRYNYLSDNPYRMTEQQCIDVIKTRHEYKGDVESMQGRSFHRLILVVEDIHAWIPLIDQLIAVREAAIGRSIDKPEGRLVPAIVWNKHF